MESRYVRGANAYRTRELRRTEKEVFGPVLHVVRYNRNELDKLVEQINASGYGLTLGVHTRIDETIAQVTGSAKVGNPVRQPQYGWRGGRRTAVRRRRVIGYRSESRRPAVPVSSALQSPTGRGRRHFRPPGCGASAGRPVENAAGKKPLQALQQWAAGRPELQALCQQYSDLAQSGTQRLLPGPTGERNTLTLMPRERVLCVADNEQDALIQLAAAMAVGCEVLWPDSALQRELAKKLPREVSERIHFAKADQLTSRGFRRGHLSR